MGGAIKAANRMADIGESVADIRIEQQMQETIYDVDKVYWLVVSLRQKQRLAESFRDLVSHLDEDVHKMIGEGVATRADGLKVDVRVNEAEMKITEVENGLSLSRMLLCQLCGLPLDTDFVLEDEDKELQVPTLETQPDGDVNLRPELRLLESAVEVSRQGEKLALAPYLPHVGLVAGYTFSNPNVFNGFEQKVGGFWNVGVMIHVPVWNWMEGKFKVRAAKTSTLMAQTTLDEAREKIDLQLAQSRFKVTEAHKKLQRANKDIESAEENLRCANAGFHEGVIDATTVMAAQTAWQQAESQRIDAEIDVRMAETTLRKTLGTLSIDR
jgi:outer membrane protein TolC